MRLVKLPIPIPMPDWLYRFLKNARGKKAAAQAPQSQAHAGTVNLTGDRDIEWSWIAARIPSGGGQALDFGSGQSSLGLLATLRGYRVTAIDLSPVAWSYRVPRLKSVQGDLLRMKFAKGTFDLVLNCSTVEHVGLAGRYGVTDERPDGDLEAMRILGRWMKPKGIMLLTIPVGIDQVFSPLTRIYGKQRLPALLDGFRVVEETYWIKKEDNLWVPGTRIATLATQTYAGSWKPEQNYYPIGCFVLQKSRTM
jgi:SAM-dependent methyltransferase